MAGFVVCASCGTQIKAGREYCLRCGEAMPAEDAPVRIPLSESLGLSERNLLALGGVASALVLALIVVIWRTGPATVDEVPQPVVVAGAVPATGAAPETATTAAVAVTASAAAPTAPPGERAAAADAMRSGGAAFATGNFEAARVAYEAALAKRPDDAETLNNLGLALERLNRLPDAVTRFERAVALAPEKAAYHFNLAHAAGELGQWDRAVAQYRLAVGLFPSDYATQYNLAMALHKKGDARSAIPEFEKAIALAPSEPSFHLSLGISLEQAGRVADAAREYRQYLLMDPSAPEAAPLKAHLEAMEPAAARPQP